MYKLTKQIKKILIIDMKRERERESFNWKLLEEKIYGRENATVEIKENES